MKPTIGRIVIYESTPNEFSGGNDMGGPVPAMIVRVWSDDCVNLKVFTDGPTCEWRTSILRGALIGQWRWPEIET